MEREVADWETKKMKKKWSFCFVLSKKERKRKKNEMLNKG